MRFKNFKQNLPNLFALLVIVVVGGVLRFYNLNWDQGHFFHPDERNIATAVSRVHFFSQLNPKFFAYGSFLIYLYRAIGDFLVFVTKDSSWVFNWGKINLISRGVSAFLSTLTIASVFFLTKKIGNEKIALLAAFFTAFNPSLIQTAHYGVTESMLIFWLLIICFLSLKIIEGPTLKNYLKIGVILGLACATKVTALSFLIVPAIAHILSYFKSLKHHFRFVLLLASVFLIFSLLSPFAYLESEKFIESLRYETGVVTGKLKVVYVLQFEKTFPYLFQIKNLFWQMGPVAPLGILGIVLLLILALRKKDKKVLTFISFPVVYFVYAGSWYTKFIRYMVPVLPFLAIAASVLFFEIKKKYKLLGKILIFSFATATFLWALAFSSIYTRESTRITASRWIYQNIPEGAEILTEHWDDGLPIPLPPESPGKYKIEQLTIYEPDSEEKVNYYAEKLSGADYIIINSRRLYGTLMYLPEKYPITSRYYHLLFSDNLGYVKIAEFSSYPSLFGIKVNDDKSEETFQVYDHPKVLIFENTKRFNKEKMVKSLVNGQ